MKIPISIILIAAFFSFTSSSLSGAEGASSGKVIAYYFHGNARCPTCHKLEAYSREAIESNFEDALRSDKLEYRTVNIDDKGNEHYASDYQLYTKSLILSLVKDGKEIKWKNMGKIWEYVGNKERFIDYVKSGVSDILKEAG